MITIYSTPTCAYCKTVKSFLDKKRIAWEEKPARGKEYGELAALYGYTVPLVWNGRQGMVGFNVAQLNALITKA